jgi:hypothetical protein
MSARPLATRLKRPERPIHDARGTCWTYQGRQFSASETCLNPQEEAELHYLRDLVAFYEQKLHGYEAWERSVHFALNTGDGSYRP